MGRKRKVDLNNYMMSNQSCSSSNSNSNGHSQLTGMQRSAANDRERTRMRVLSKAFVRLKTSLPWVPSDTKLSKLDTLKLATSYISYLTRVLQEGENTDDTINNTNLNANLSSYNFYNHHQSTKMVFNIKSNSTEKYKKINDYLNNYSMANTNESKNEFCWPFNSNGSSIIKCEKDDEYCKLFMINNQNK